ncbi:FAD-binding oxidoreductase [Phytoactinopolyspora limicola]|uniref:FAD-binding oxidoreductase n=1 Tax=Phytoactinopolyspora limicola TaxID=2715536 RepID=UPI001409A234|nr:FAD-binding oxidoreductase [Phytoactinopolyspora limicola]
MTTHTSATTTVVDRLRADAGAPVLTPADPGYDAARMVAATLVDRRPAAIVRPTGADQIARVVTMTREAGIDLAVRGGGHSLAGHGVSGDVVVDLSALDTVHIDADRRIGTAGGGVTAGSYTAAAGQHGLATGFGDTASVGIGGITLGGGIGLLTRKQGLSIDSLLAAEVVTADGQILEVDEANHPDLFWALRGGGGNFGVVTRFTFRLHHVPEVVGGFLALPATAGNVRAFAAEARMAPEELSMMVVVMKAPPMPFVPPEHHGTPIIFAFMCYAGPGADGERALAPFRKIATPLMDQVQPGYYADLFAGDERPAVHSVTRSMFLDDIGDDTAELVMEGVRSATDFSAVVQFRPLGGAVARVPADATAFAHRDRGYAVMAASLFQQAEMEPECDTWVSGFAAGLSGGSAPPYVNFLGDEGPDRVQAAYPGRTWDRLREVKRRYDPDNVFHANHNIPPSP